MVECNATRPRFAGKIEKGEWPMNAPGSFKEPLALVILNASRDSLRREARAKALHDAGYYTSSAQSPEEAIMMATQMKCAVAILCDSFTPSENQLVHACIQETVPATTVIFLGTSADDNVLLSAVRAA